MNPEARPILERLLEESGALARGHFLLSSGLHSPAYVQCALLLEDPVRARRPLEPQTHESDDAHADRRPARVGKPGGEN